MLRKTTIALAMVAALTGGLTADAFARGGGGGGGGGGHGGGGGGGHMGGGFGGGHMGGGFGGGHMGGGFGGGHMGGGFRGGHMGGEFGRGFEGRHFAGARHFDHDRRFRRGFGDFGFYDYGCSYGYANYNPYSCYLPAY